MRDLMSDDCTMPRVVREFHEPHGENAWRIVWTGVRYQLQIMVQGGDWKEVSDDKAFHVLCTLLNDKDPAIEVMPDGRSLVPRGTAT